MTKAFDCAMRLLSRREHGAYELCGKLKHKGFDQTQAEEALKLCQELGLQCDTRYVESYSRSRIRQGYGPLKILQELKNKSVDADLIHSVLSQENENWLDYALKVWQKKRGGQINLSLADMQKQQRFLLYRGFNVGIVQECMKKDSCTLVHERGSE